MSAPHIQPSRYDAVAVLASGLCLAHCLLLPALILVIPAWAAWLAVPDSFHLWMLAFAAFSSALALYLGKQRHRRWTPTAIALPGLVALASGAVLFHDLALETLLTVIGALGLSVAHILNGRISRATEI
jgi:hypothetical protein